MLNKNLKNAGLIKDKNFLIHYKENIYPLIPHCNNYRIKALRKYITKLITVPLIYILYTPVALLTTLIFVSRYDLIHSLINSYKSARRELNTPVKEYRDKVKAEFLPHTLNYFGNFNYQANNFDIVETFEQSGIIPDYSYEENTDLFTGSHKSVNITCFSSCLSDIKIMSDRLVNLSFKGFIICLEMNKEFKGTTIIKKDAGLISQLKLSPGLERINLEDPIFEDEFEAYSSDQIEARYLITTAFMERLLKLKNTLTKKSLECSFYNNKLLLLVYNDNELFSTNSSLFKHNNLIEDSRIIFEDLKMILETIETLKLDKNLGL